ncbi:MAG TPA: hypothetical protein VHP61_01195 [Acidobacteriota bacterium]|nr:hypothetical protein [Acidobacteriota bacterium]
MMDKKAREGLAIALMMIFCLGGSVTVSAQDRISVIPHAASLDRLFVLQDTIRDIHPAFETLYPVAIVYGGQFHIYEPDMGKRAYRFVLEAPDKFHVPVGIRAAMPLDFWGNKIACVVTPEVFIEPGGYAIIFHEFVHCYQWETCEPRLKESLRVYRKAMDGKDFMWELEHPFPYGDADFARDYKDLLSMLGTGEEGRVVSIRTALKERLSREDWEYMTWQEWKEGTARYLENEIKARLGLPVNKGGMEPPFTRVSFYAGGERLIRMLDKMDPGLARTIETLYQRIAD